MNKEKQCHTFVGLAMDGGGTERLVGAKKRIKGELNDLAHDGSQ